MSIDTEKIYKTTWEHYQKAKNNVIKESVSFSHRDHAISDAIPGFVSEKLEFGSYDKANFAVLFVDMRDSTLRAQSTGAEKTFLTMHVYLTALLEVVKHYEGKVIDIMGDGIMVFWGGKEAIDKENMFNKFSVQKAGLCGRDMLVVREKVINPIIEKEDLGAKINMGVGVTFDSVIVTKIGISDSYDVKAFGDCINIASKYAGKSLNRVKLSKKVKNLWPEGKNGTIRFEPVPGEDSFYLAK